MSTVNLHNTINLWLQLLAHHNFQELSTKPSEKTWSIGQVYMHLIENTEFFIAQAAICTTNNDNAQEHATAEGAKMFANNNFPDAVLEGPPSNNDTPQPASKQQIIEGLQQLQNQLSATQELIAKSNCVGKTRHPGLGYFDAQQWLQFADMHMRHHLRQKKRIDDLLHKKPQHL